MNLDPFAFSLEIEDIRRERHVAREIRQSQWWKRRIARGRCDYCGGTVTPQELTMDHIVPVSRGGRSTRGNLACACKDCNTAKRQLLPMEWKQYLCQFER